MGYGESIAATIVAQCNDGFSDVPLVISIEVLGTKRVNKSSLSPNVRSFALDCSTQAL